jgi:hypothetical protein
MIPVSIVLWTLFVLVVTPGAMARADGEVATSD